MANFPGNPYALAKGTSTSPEQAIYQAIMTLAYEQRTANQLARLDKIGTDLKGLSEDAAQEWIEQAVEIDARLGHGE